MSGTPPAAPRPSRARWRRALLALALGTAGALVAGELALRLLLFHEAELPRRLGWSVRRIEHFGDIQSDEELWKLQWRLSDRGGAQPSDSPDPIVGWRGSSIGPDFRHRLGDELPRFLGERRLVLLFGDSYAQCATPPSQCFQRLVADSDLGSRFLLLNCGVGGYGIDQVHLLIRQVAPNYAELDPVVVVGVFTDDDLDRTVLGIRCWPKPRLRVAGGALDYGEPVETDVEAWLERHPMRPTSFLRRLLAYRPGLLPSNVAWPLRYDHAELTREKRELSRAILEAIAADLRALELDFFVLGFTGEALLRQSEETWQERVLRDFARERGVPLIETDPFLLAASGGDAKLAERLFGGGPRLQGHYNAEGNRVAFEALRQGLLGRFEPLDVSRVARTAEEAAAVDVGTFQRPGRLLGRPCTITWSDPESCIELGTPSLEAYEDTGTFCTRAGQRGPTVVTWNLRGKARAFRAHVTVEPGEQGELRAARFTLAVDGGAPVEHRLGPGLPPITLDHAIAGARELELRVEPLPGERMAAWIVFHGARFE